MLTAFLTAYMTARKSSFLPGTSSKRVLRWAQPRSGTRIQSALKIKVIIEVTVWSADPTHLNAISEGTMLYYSSFLIISVPQPIFEPVCAILP